MVSIRQTRQSKRRLLSQLVHSDQDSIIGHTVSHKQENAAVNESTGDQDFTVATSDIILMTNEDTVNVKTLENCFNEWIDRERTNIVDTFEDRIQNAILTAIDSIVVPKIELTTRSKTRPLDQTRPVSRQIQSVGNLYGLLPLLGMYPKRIIH